MRATAMSVTAAVAILAGSAWAGPVTYTFTGSVTANSFTSGTLTAVSVNDSATWQYTFENTAGGSYAINGPGTTEWYQFTNVISSGSVQIGSVSASSNNGTIIQYNSLSGGNDIYDANLFGTGLVAANHRVTVRLGDGLGTAFDSSSIASLSPDLNFSAFGSRTGFVLEVGTTNQLNILWTGLQIDNPAIPLPTGAAMAMVGMGVIGIRRRRDSQG